MSCASNNLQSKIKEMIGNGKMGVLQMGSGLREGGSRKSGAVKEGMCLGRQQLHGMEVINMDCEHAQTKLKSKLN